MLNLLLCLINFLVYVDLFIIIVMCGGLNFIGIDQVVVIMLCCWDCLLKLVIKIVGL